MKILKKILVTLIIIIVTYLFTIYNLKVENVEQSEGGYLITVNNQNYFFEVEE